jgi:hypothetical protein
MDQAVISSADYLSGMFNKNKVPMTSIPFNDVRIHTVNLKNVIPSNDFYLDTNVFNDFLKFILKNINEANQIFVKFNTGLCTNIDRINSILDYAITYDFHKWIMYTPKQMKPDISRCLDYDSIDSNIRYIVIPIHLNFLESGHSNVIIIDKQKHTIDFFEPHGIQMSHHYNDIIDINSIVIYYLKVAFPQLRNYSVINAARTCILGPQAVQGGNQGHCLAWSLYYIFLRLINFDIDKNTTQHTSEIINSFMVTQPSRKLDRMIRKFISFVKTFTIPSSSLVSNQLNPDNNMMISFETEAQQGIQTAILFQLERLTDLTNHQKWDFFKSLRHYHAMYRGTYDVLKNVILQKYISSPLVDAQLYQLVDLDYLFASFDAADLALMQREAVYIINNFFNPLFDAHKFSTTVEHLLSLQHSPHTVQFPSVLLDLLAKIYTSNNFNRYQQQQKQKHYLRFLSRNCTPGRGGWTTTELTKLCRILGLPTSGNKHELCQRLHQYFQ